SEYGVPTRPGMHHHREEGGEEVAEEEHGAEGVSIGLEQIRADLRGSLDLGNGLFSELTTRWAYSDYTHTEFEGDEVGTTFSVDGIEGRVELIQRERGGWRGSVGGQYMRRNFAAVGAEAFVPANTTENLALFTLQEVDFDPFEIELGARFERSTVEAETLAARRTFDTVSAAAGFAYSPMPGVRLGINGSRAARSPSAEELFANGPHIATQQFEIGNPNLRQETALGLEGYVRANMGGADLGLSVYRTWFDDFVYLRATGDEIDELPVYGQMQQGADYFGVEAEASFPLFRVGGFRMVGDIQGDYTRAPRADGPRVPRIPPPRQRGGPARPSGPRALRAEAE